MAFVAGKGGKNINATIAPAIVSSRSRRHHQLAVLRDAVLRELWGKWVTPAWLLSPDGGRNACSSSSRSSFPDSIVMTLENCLKNS